MIPSQLRAVAGQTAAIDNRPGRLLLAIAACSIIIVCPALARAQSAVDGFDPGAGDEGDDVLAVAVQPDGKIVVGGSFNMLGGGGYGTNPRSFIGRVNADGSLDALFNPGANITVFALALQPNGKILVGGAFTTLGGATRNGIGRLNADGSLDTSFSVNVNDTVNGVAVQADGKIVIAGLFSSVGTAMRARLGRLSLTDVATQRLTATSRVVSWSRSGAGPEVWRVTFESSPDGLKYTPLGNGARVAGGWQLSGQNLPVNKTLFIRARGYYGSGQQNGSSSVVESVRAAYPGPYQPFTDDVLITGTTVVRAVHVSELRTRINALHIHFGLTAFAYTNATLAPDTTIIQAPHINELRTALSQAYAAAGLTAPVYTDPALAAGMTIKAAHIAELRAAVAAIE